MNSIPLMLGCRYIRRCSVNVGFAMPIAFDGVYVVYRNCTSGLTAVVTLREFHQQFSYAPA